MIAGGTLLTTATGEGRTDIEAPLKQKWSTIVGSSRLGRNIRLGTKRTPPSSARNGLTANVAQSTRQRIFPG